MAKLMQFKFLSLAALYERWAIPFAVLMDMPRGALGVLAASSIFDKPNDVYFKLGLMPSARVCARS